MRRQHQKIAVIRFPKPITKSETERLLNHLNNQSDGEMTYWIEDSTFLSSKSPKKRRETEYMHGTMHFPSTSRGETHLANLSFRLDKVPLLDAQEFTALNFSSSLAGLAMHDASYKRHVEDIRVVREYTREYFQTHKTRESA